MRPANHDAMNHASLQKRQQRAAAMAAIAGDADRVAAAIRRPPAALLEEPLDVVLRRTARGESIARRGRVAGLSMVAAKEQSINFLGPLGALSDSQREWVAERVPLLFSGVGQSVPLADPWRLLRRLQS